MLLKESDLYGSNDFDFIESLDSLSESEMIYTANMVPIRHIDRLNSNLIQLEEFVKYGTFNGITNGHKAIGAVCEASMINNDSSIGFVVNEASLYEDDELVEITQSIKEAGYKVYITPVSENSIYYQQLMEAFNKDFEAESFKDSYHLQAYCEGTIKDNLNKIKYAVGGVGNRAGQNMIRIKNHIQNGTDAVKSAATTAGDSVKTLANKYSAAKQAVRNFTDKASKAPESLKQTANNTLQKAKDTATTIKNKLVAAKQGS
jgi:hypothetical protein